MPRDRVWDILESSPVGMLTTCFDGGLRARPLDARPDRDASVIFFVIDVRGLKDEEVKARPEVCFTVIDAEHRAYLSITGHATTFYERHCFEKSGNSQMTYGGLMGCKTKTLGYCVLNREQLTFGMVLRAQQSRHTRCRGRD
jgi:hypothetical protein